MGVVGIVIEKPAVVRRNAILSDHADMIMDVWASHQEKDVSIIALIGGWNTDRWFMTGKLGNLKNVTVKSAMTKSY